MVGHRTGDTENVSERYEIRLAGKLSEGLLTVFEGMTVQERPAETVLRGPVRDQADLHRLIDQAHELGLKLVAVRQITSEGDQ